MEIKLNKQGIERAKGRLKDVRLSHQQSFKVREGDLIGMYQKKLSNYDGYGHVITVYGTTSDEADAIALLVLRAIKSGLPDIEAGEYGSDGHRSYTELPGEENYIEPK